MDEDLLAVFTLFGSLLGFGIAIINVWAGLVWFVLLVSSVIIVAFSGRSKR